MSTLFIIDRIYPVPTSNGVCVKRVSECFENTYILALSDEKETVKDNIFSFQYKRKPSKVFNRLFRYCEDTTYVNFVYEKAKELIDIYNIDSVVCVYQPVENLIVGIKLKKMFPSVRVIGYFLDCIGEYNYSNVLKKNLFTFNLKRLLKKFLITSDFALVLKYYRDIFDRYKSICNISYVGIPNLIDMQITNSTNTDYFVTYLGSFNEQFRNPVNCLTLFDNCNIPLHLFSVGCEQVINKFANKSIIVQHKFVSSDSVPSIINNSSFLLNVSNTLQHAVPGKLIEYFSSGKPIINYVFSKNDPSLSECYKYPNILVLFDGEDGNDEKLSNFVKKEFSKIDLSMIRNIFLDSTPQHTAELIINHNNETKC